MNSTPLNASGVAIPPPSAAAPDAPHLPAVPDDAAVDGPIYQGEFTDDEPAAAPPPPAGRTVTLTLSPGAHGLLRHGVHVFAGALILLRRWHDARTRHDRMMRAAEAAGDHENMQKWADLRIKHLKEKRERHEARRDTVVNLIKVMPLAGAVFLAVMLGLGLLLAIAARHIAMMAVPWIILARVVAVGFAVASTVAFALLLAVPLAVITWLWHTGRTASDGPTWMRTSADAEDVTIDEHTIARALGALGIPQIARYLKDGLPLQFLTPCRRDGRGTHAVVRLPTGVTAQEIVTRRAKFASGLYRAAKEVWPTTGDEAGILDVWAADKGALAEGAGPYPLLDQGFTDVFKGLPFGRTLRGDPMRIPVTGRNTLCGGMPEQGKSTAARAVAAGYSLDMTAEVRIYIPDTNFDFEVFKPRCSRYVMGAEDEHIETILGDLEELKDELQARGQLLVDYEQPEVTRQLANAGVGLHPVFWLLEEAHVAIQHRKFGKDISLLLCENVKLDRKRGVHMMLSTQAPTKDSMPRDVTRNCSNGIAFAVGDHVANDALLGQGAYAGGHRATELIPGTDRGTALCKGFNGQRSEVVQVHFLSVARGDDQVSPLIVRSLAAMAKHGRGLPGGESPRAIEARDLLADLDEVLGADRVRLADVPSMLRRLAPAWGLYRSLTGEQLKSLLADRGVRWTNSGNVPRLDPAEVRRVLHREGELDERHSPRARPQAPHSRVT